MMVEQRQDVSGFLLEDDSMFFNLFQPQQFRVLLFLTSEDVHKHVEARPFQLATCYWLLRLRVPMPAIFSPPQQQFFDGGG